jgi:FAD:protein FMN transferase
MRRKALLTLFPFLAIFLAGYLYISSGNASTIVERTNFCMGTIVRIKVPTGNRNDKTRANEAVNKAFEEINRVEDVFSVYKDTSEISRINRLRKDEKLRASDEVFDLIEKSIEFSKKTEGAFDITVKPLVDLWGKAKKGNRLPTEDEIKLALDRVGYEKIILDEIDRTISFKKEGMALDMGGIAKGYATGRAIGILKKNGIDDAIVSTAGDLYCLGRRSKNKLWKVGVQDPRRKNRIFSEIELEDMAISTSGDYERYFILNGRRYSHIIDPRTGYPVGDDVVSSSVIASDSSTADILATSLAILGDKGLTVAKSVKGVDAIIVFKRNDKFIVKMTDGIKKRYEIHEENL